MQILILAGGLGTRLGSLTADIPKGMLPIQGKPFIEHQIELFKANGIHDIVIAVAHYGEQIQQYFGDGSSFGVRIQYSVDGPTLLGTGGAIKKAAHLLDEAFFVIYGDSYLRLDYQDVDRVFEESGCPALMTIFRNADVGEKSNVLASEGRILKYDKWTPDPAMVYVDYGLSVLRKSLLDRIPPETKFPIEEIYRQLASEGRLAAYEAKETFYEIGSTRGIEQLERLLGFGS